MWDRYRLDFDRSAYLLLLLLLPPLVVWSYRGLSGLGNVRRGLALALRAAVITLLILAAAEVRWVRTSRRLTVIYLLDQSWSIPAEHREAMQRLTSDAIAQHRRGDDRAGVIVFGRQASIEVPPIDESVPLAGVSETSLDARYTNLAAAMRLAQASFPEDAAKRIVIVSDGNENLGSALEQARVVADLGVGIDVQPVIYRRRAEVAVEKLAVPNEVRQGQPFDLRVVLQNSAEPTAADPGTVAGRVVVTRQGESGSQVISDQPVQLPHGKQVFTLRQELAEASGYTYEARFVPDQPGDDAMPQNNRATAFTHIRGSGRVLLLEDAEHPGEFDTFAARLRTQELDVTLRNTEQLFTSLPELQAFDSILLANVPREAFSDAQIKMLVRNTEQLGAGLVMLGGPSSFGAGGWTNTEVEAAMPVDFQIKNAKIAPRGALVMIMHASEIPEGNYWQKVVAQESIKTLGHEDYCGVLHWDGREQWLWNPPQGLLKVGPARAQMLARVDRMAPGDMPDFDPSLNLARKSLAALTDAAVKHVVVVSDGDPSPPSSGVVRSLKAARITVSTVAVGAHGPAESRVLKQLAEATQGKYYEVANARALPRIFQREARRVASPLVFESPDPFRPQIQADHEILRGLPSELPTIQGFVLTARKQNPLVEILATSPRPANPDNNTLLATWTYGLGRTAVFTTDVGARWASAWPAWEGYDKFFAQLVRWSMRPLGQQGQFTLSTDVHEGQVRVVVSSLDEHDQFLNFLPLTGTVVGPELDPLPLEVTQTAPGRYEATFAAEEPGSYYLQLNPGPGLAPLRAGVSVPYSAEFRQTAADLTLLQNLAGHHPLGAPPGVLVRNASQDTTLQSLATFNPFRHDLPPATSGIESWHLVAFLAGLLFFADVFVRRVALDLAGAWRTTWARLRGQRTSSPSPTEQALERLRARKAEVQAGLQKQQAAARFESTTTADTSSVTSEFEAASGPPRPPAASDAGLAPDVSAPEETYTERLLRAKRASRPRPDNENCSP